MSESETRYPTMPSKGYVTTTALAPLLGVPQDLLSYNCKKGLIPCEIFAGPGKTRRRYGVPAEAVARLLAGELAIQPYPTRLGAPTDPDPDVVALVARVKALEARVYNLEDLVTGEGKGATT